MESLILLFQKSVAKISESLAGEVVVGNDCDLERFRAEVAKTTIFCISTGIWTIRIVDLSTGISFSTVVICLNPRARGRTIFSLFPLDIQCTSQTFTSQPTLHLDSTIHHLLPLPLPLSFAAP